MLQKFNTAIAAGGITQLGPVDRTPEGVRDASRDALHERVKMLLRARAATGGWKTFVQGQIGQNCQTVCALATCFVPQWQKTYQATCAGVYINGQYRQRAYPPYEDPYINGYACDGTDYPPDVPKCMCEMGGIGCSDAEIVLVGGATFW